MDQSNFVSKEDARQKLNIPEAKYNAEVQIKSWREKPYFDQLVDLFIRPPRQIYEMKNLGPSTFFYQNLLIHREDFLVTSSRGLSLQCSLYSAVRFKDQQRPCVIYLHGNSSSRLEGNSYAGIVTSEGMSLLNFDFGGCGISDGEHVSLGWYEKDDLLSVIEQLRKTHPKITKYGLWGRSMGAVTAILAASDNHELKVIVADSPFANLQQVCIDIGEQQYCLPKIIIRLAYYMLRKRIVKLAKYDPKQLKITQYLRQIPHCKILFLRASEDRMIHQNQVDTLYQACRGEKYINIFQGDHNSARPLEVLQNIITYIFVSMRRFFVRRLQPDKKLLMPLQVDETKKKIQAQFAKKLEVSNHSKDTQEIALEQALEEKINDTLRQQNLNFLNDDSSENSQRSCPDENMVSNNPLYCDYTVGKQIEKQIDKLMVLSYVSVDSERQIKVSPEMCQVNTLPEFKEAHKFH